MYMADKLTKKRLMLNGYHLYDGLALLVCFFNYSIED
jgi:hypothetical protein